MIFKQKFEMLISLVRTLEKRNSHHYQKPEFFTPKIMKTEIHIWKKNMKKNSMKSIARSALEYKFFVLDSSISSRDFHLSILYHLNAR